MQIKPECVSWSAIRSCSEECGVMRRAVGGHDLGRTDTYTNKAPRAGVQLVVHTSINGSYGQVSCALSIVVLCN